MSRQQHDAYGKSVLRMAGGTECRDYSPHTEINYGDSRAYIDGTVSSLVAVEIESRTGKQVRGAVLDLILHRYPKKLLILIPMYIGKNTPGECAVILGKFVEPGDYRVVLLAGTGDYPQYLGDAAVVRTALEELGCELPPLDP